ncbi:TlpA disulfide reductase family protein [Pedobacter sp. KBW01]|uniref:TlpA disulfide reductase family protein n=1 Tax=Pedobacter sp. KBW01 TaxID=2153364 RepID=UPI00131A158F|nr:TlpA disulfide reductase family protein [Pedobacter sp. KBW01]
MLVRSGLLDLYLCDFILIIAYTIFATIEKKEVTLICLILIPWLAMSIFGAIVNYDGLYPIVIPFCVLFASLPAQIIIALRGRSMKTALISGLVCAVFFVAKNIYIYPQYYYTKGNLKVSDQSNFITETEKMLYLTSSHDSVSLFQYKGKVLYVELWYSSCSPCLDKIPMIKRVKEEFKNRSDFKTIGIIDGEIDDFDTFKKASLRYGSAFNVSLMADVKLVALLHKTLGTKGYPLELMIDKSGKIRTIHLGFNKAGENYYYKQTVKTLNTLLNEK